MIETKYLDMIFENQWIVYSNKSNIDYKPKQKEALYVSSICRKISFSLRLPLGKLLRLR